MKQQYCIDTIQPDLELPAAPKLNLAHDVMGAVRRMFTTLCAWQYRVEMRSRMAQLDAKTLDDIGLSRKQVMAEAQKPFWKA